MNARWVGGAAALATLLLNLAAVADARDCTGATPLPADTTITQPAADVPADLAKFSGAWTGVWTDGAGASFSCTTLVVEDVFANGYVRFGLTLTVDDVAKLSMLLHARGRHDGVQILSAAKIDGALRRTAPGLSTLVPSRFGDQRYHLSVWSLPYRTALGCSFHVPYLWGFGGNFVVLLPNGVSAFRFADGAVHDLETMILAGEAIRPFCTAPPVDAPPKTVQTPPLSAAELRAELPGNTFGAGGLRVFIAPDGRQYSAIGTGVDVGRWRITADGLYCRTSNVSDGGRERCYHVFRDGAVFTFHVHDRWTVFRWTRSVVNISPLQRRAPARGPRTRRSAKR